MFSANEEDHPDVSVSVRNHFYLHEGIRLCLIAPECLVSPSWQKLPLHPPSGSLMLTKTQEYIEFRCTERCLLLYHTGDCHRKDVKLKMEREHGVWKEEEGARCITPDCPGTLTKGTKWNRFGKVSYQVSVYHGWLPSV